MRVLVKVNGEPINLLSAAAEAGICLSMNDIKSVSLYVEGDDGELVLAGQVGE